MKLFSILLLTIAFSATSCGSLRNTSDCGLAKSLKIENIHDTKGPKIILVNNVELTDSKEKDS